MFTFEHAIEQFEDVMPCDGRGLLELQPMLHTEVGDFGLADRPGLLARLYQVDFIAHQEDRDALIAVVLDGVEPLHDILEGLAFGDVEDQEGPLALPVVAGGDGPVLLGPRCVDTCLYRCPRSGS